MSDRARVTYAIVAHRRERQLYRLVQALRTESPHSSVVIHWDRNARPLDATALTRLGDVHLVEDPVHPEWGDFGMVSAVLSLMRTAVARTRFDWFVLLSGQDYPIAPLARIERELAAADCDAFIDARRIASGRLAFRWRRREATRLGRRYYFRYARLPRIRRRVPAPLRSAALRAAFALDAHQPLLAIWPMPAGIPWRVGVRRLRTPFRPERRCRVGSSWFNLSARGVHTVLDHVRDRPELVRHYRRTLHADESFFQTIICGELGLAVSSDTRRFQVWQRDGSPLHPETLSSDRMPALVRSGQHFARKLDEAFDPRVLDAIDLHRRAEWVAR